MKLRALASLMVLSAGLETGLWAMKTWSEPALPKEAQGPAKSASAREVKPNPVFNEIIPSLVPKTHVPLRLPEYVPDSDDKETPLYAILEVAELESYSIQLAWDKNCEGGNACHVGYVGGTKTPPHEPEKPEALVSLRDGIKGSFAGFDCGAHCDDASLHWTEGGYYYGITLKAGDRKTLIRMANSAIEAGAKQSH